MIDQLTVWSYLTKLGIKKLNGKKAESLKIQPEILLITEQFFYGLSRFYS